MRTNKEENILIAEFLGWQKHDSYNYITPFFRNYINVGGGMSESSIFRIEELAFHKNWDWLMLAVKKILDICSEEHEEFDIEDFYQLRDQIPDLYQTYKGIIFFIDEYNKYINS